ncbi:succinylglutamate desuccinylase/aspartoacylase family protein [Tenacibaculum tangerinum]|uniref:Succinylglutamate desuccinylase/aspartoacylase family protein n=1 Tax=Tenacibaculum tangerinum TaxID=3038772 RepID=A0ABY8L4X1_9FLAO|nr:succinylglutamate desuccinylase/aspartoacylase family protein [Tenacibaculum tangerinum]WGH76463.1 succinylglutamate desuccinylase/aspartoacylase family protein [Tenacibaculum tangerinum]
MKENKIYSSHFNKTITIKRVLGSIKGAHETPTVIFFAGIHGNEIAGVIALNSIISHVEKEAIHFRGNMYAICGNIAAIKKNVRYNKVDLNRIWSQELMHQQQGEDIPEFEEQTAIYNAIKDIVNHNQGPFYFIDLHTTSSDSIPFITISDSLNNRKFSSNFKIPTILGIEEFLEGPLLTFINEFGHVSIGFEAGQHFKESSVDNCIAFVWLALVASGCVAKKDVEKMAFYEHYLSMYNENQEFYEIKYRYVIKEGELFNMLEGFSNFDRISVGDALAMSESKTITAEFDGKIFMPLYQKQGEDGFFIIRKISTFWLSLSRIVRNLHLHTLLKILPGVKSDQNNSYTLIVNPKTARFLATEIFHLFGYRKTVKKNGKLYFFKRDRKVTMIA